MQRLTKITPLYDLPYNDSPLATKLFNLSLVVIGEAWLLFLVGYSVFVVDQDLSPLYKSYFTFLFYSGMLGLYMFLVTIMRGRSDISQKMYVLSWLVVPIMFGIVTYTVSTDFYGADTLHTGYLLSYAWVSLALFFHVSKDLTEHTGIRSIKLIIGLCSAPWLLSLFDDLGPAAVALAFALLLGFMLFIEVYIWAILNLVRSKQQRKRWLRYLGLFVLLCVIFSIFYMSGQIMLG